MYVAKILLINTIYFFALSTYYYYLGKNIGSNFRMFW